MEMEGRRVEDFVGGLGVRGNLVVSNARLNQQLKVMAQGAAVG